MKKPMSDIKFIFHTKSPLTIYKQMHKGNVRLNIDVHGSPYKSGQGGLYVGDALYSPGMLHDWLKTVVDLQTIHYIRLVSCFSAYGGGSSFVSVYPDCFLRCISKVMLMRCSAKCLLGQ